MGAKTDLRQGRLQVASINAGQITWLDLPDSDGRDTPLRHQLGSSAKFRDGE